MSNEMPPFPDEADYTPSASLEHDYHFEIALRKAWEARARAAVMRLRDAEQALSNTYDLQQHPGEGSDCDTEVARNRVRATLTAIGPLPEQKPSKASKEVP